MSVRVLVARLIYLMSITVIFLEGWEVLLVLGEKDIIYRGGTDPSCQWRLSSVSALGLESATESMRVSRGPAVKGA